jgi:hypothetical protein
MDILRLEGLCKLKKINLIGPRSRDLLPCSIVTQELRYRLSLPGEEKSPKNPIILNIYKSLLLLIVFLFFNNSCYMFFR